MKKDFLRSGGYFILEVLKILVISLAIIIPIRYLIIQPFFVKGDSMEPNFNDGNYLIINELTYRFSEPSRGDVIVFKYPRDPSQYFIKRVIGLPGERVEIKDEKVAVYNGEYPSGILLEEGNYLPFELQTPGDISITLKDDQYYVLGDNRRASSDSRSWGVLEKNNIIGKVWLRLWPVSEAHAFSTPDYSYLAEY